MVHHNIMMSFIITRVIHQKVVVSYANIYANGYELNRNTFSDGLDTECFSLLNENGFVIQRKSISYYLLGAAWYGREDNPDQSERFIENGIWENSNEDRFIDIVERRKCW
jgi:hypothetical protein